MFATMSISRNTLLMLMLMVLGSLAANAQLEPVDGLKMNLNGNLGYGYSGAFGDSTLSSNHSSGFNGYGDLTGYYFHPNFLSFQFRPYYDRTQSNTESQLLSRGTGFGASASFFGGSHFPGSISFGKDFSTNSEFRIAGVPTVSGDSSGQTFGISWSAIFPKLPVLSASYSIGSTDSSFEDSIHSTSSSKNLNLNSSYRIAGFDWQGYFTNGNSKFTSPAILTVETLNGDTTSTTYGMSTQHALPLRGSLGVGWSHSNLSTPSGADFSTDSYYAGTSITPWQRLSLYQNVNYTTDLSAALAQSVLNGANVTGANQQHELNGLFYMAGASYQVFRGLSLNGRFTHRIQTISGKTYEDTQYGGSLNYNRTSRLFGFLYFGFGVVDTASKIGNEGMGFNGIVGMNRRFGAWETSADFTYSQNVQTLVYVATTSSYSYGGSVQRKINQDLRFGGSFRSSRSGLVVQEGNGNHSESASGGFSWRRYNLSGSYSQSSGTAVFTSGGVLTPTPIGPVITEDITLFNARSVGVNGSTLFFRRLTLAGGYNRFTSSTTRDANGLFSSGNRYSVRTEYRLRKFSFTGGYNRSLQEISSVPGGPRRVNSFYLSLSRWFNVF